MIGPALAPIVDEFVSNCSKEADSGTVSLNNSVCATQNTLDSSCTLDPQLLTCSGIVILRSS